MPRIGSSSAAPLKADLRLDQPAPTKEAPKASQDGDKMATDQRPKIASTKPSEQKPDVRAKITELTANDPKQKISQTKATGELKITGTASNNGIIGSFASFELEGKKIDLAITGKWSPLVTAQKLKAALPSGFSGTIIAAKTPGGPAYLRISKAEAIASPQPTGKPDIDNVRSNDPTQLAQRGYEGNDLLIMNAGTNSGPTPSLLSLTLDGKEISVWIGNGQTAHQTALKLARILPKGYEAQFKAPSSPDAFVYMRFVKVTADDE